MEPCMESGTSVLPWEFVSEVVHRHVHDVRNHLNGVEMETSLLEDLSLDPMARDALARLRSEAKQVEAEMRSLHIRFAAPHRSSFAVIDLFNLWKSRCMALTPKASIEWECDSDEHQIEVDGRMVADALSEQLLRATTSPLQAIVRSDQEGAIFEIREPDDGKSEKQPELPGLGTVIERNGGTFNRSLAKDRREWTTVCWFPLC